MCPKSRQSDGLFLLVNIYDQEEATKEASRPRTCYTIVENADVVYVFITMVFVM